MRGEKTCNGGQWTDARFHAFIMSALRKAHSKWGPKNRAKTKARVRRGFYLCAGCGEVVPASIKGVYKTGPKAGKPRKLDNAAVDHINPVIDPAEGFVSYDRVIERMFVEDDGYQILCRNCHSSKTAEERVVRTEARKGSEA